MDLCSLTESDICDQFITPAIQAAGWDATTQVRREVTYTAGRIWVHGRLASRTKKRKRADYVLYYRAGIPLAVIEAKRFEEFTPETAWWENRTESEQSWCVPIEDIRARGYNLDIKNPNVPELTHEDPDVLLERYEQARAQTAAIREELKAALAACLLREESGVEE
ncbi:MAG: hypothetical protein Q8K67_08060 [Geothrix sp.]|nr:hypothetical protein [Geothrix sp.]